MEVYEKKDESCVVVALVVVLDGVRTTAQKLCVKSLYEIHHHDHGDVPMCPFFFCCPAGLLLRCSFFSSLHFCRFFLL